MLGVRGATWTTCAPGTAAHSRVWRQSGVGEGGGGRERRCPVHVPRKHGHGKCLAGTRMIMQRVQCTRCTVRACAHGCALRACPGGAPRPRQALCDPSSAHVLHTATAILSAMLSRQSFLLPIRPLQHWKNSANSNFLHACQKGAPARSTGGGEEGCRGWPPGRSVPRFHACKQASKRARQFSGAWTAHTWLARAHMRGCSRVSSTHEGPAPAAAAPSARQPRAATWRCNRVVARTSLPPPHLFALVSYLSSRWLTSSMEGTLMW